MAGTKLGPCSHFEAKDDLARVSRQTGLRRGLLTPIGIKCLARPAVQHAGGYHNRLSAPALTHASFVVVRRWALKPKPGKTRQQYL